MLDDFGPERIFLEPAPRSTVEEAEALAGGALAETELGDDFVEGEGFFRAKEDTEDFADGLGDAERGGELDEELRSLMEVL